MRSTRLIAPILLVWMVLCAGIVSGQNFPSKPIRILAAEVGGSGDFVARLTALGLASSLGQSVIVENRGGPGIPQQIVAHSPPDGYTLLSVASTGLWITPLIQAMSYDPVRDFSPITLAGSSPNILVVHPSLPAKSVSELIALAKSKPGALNYASGVSGSSSHLAAELFNAMAGVRIVRIPYKGNGPAVIALVGGEVQVMFSSAAAVAPQLKSGKLTVIAVTSAQPSALFPGLPTVAASGLPGYRIENSLGLFTTARTPATVIKRLNQEIVRVLNRAETKERFAAAGIEVVASSPEELAAAIKFEMSSIGKVVKDIGIRPE